jgi:hypothetical protein
MKLLQDLLRMGFMFKIRAQRSRTEKIVFNSLQTVKAGCTDNLTAPLAEIGIARRSQLIRYFYPERNEAIIEPAQLIASAAAQVYYPAWQRMRVDKVRHFCPRKQMHPRPRQLAELVRNWPDIGAAFFFDESRFFPRHLRLQRFIDRRTVDINEAAIGTIPDLPYRVRIAVGGPVRIVTPAVRTVPLYNIDGTEIRTFKLAVNRL